MSNEEMAVLAQSGDKVALNELWAQVEKLAAWHCIRYYKRIDPDKLAARGVTIEDIQQERYFAFLEAVRAFDSTTGYKFATYMKYPLLTALNSLVGLRTVHGRKEPLNSCGSLDEPLPGTDDLFLADMVEDSQAASDFENTEEQEYRRQLHNALEEAISLTCDDRQREVLKSRYYEGKTQKVCGEALGVSHSMVRQLEQKALRNMRHPKAKRLLSSFHEEAIATAAYSLSTSWGAWDAKGSNPERAVEKLETYEELSRKENQAYLERIRSTQGEETYKAFHRLYAQRGMI